MCAGVYTPLTTCIRLFMLATMTICCSAIAGRLRQYVCVGPDLLLQVIG